MAKDDDHFRNPEWEIDGHKVDLLVAPANDRGLVVPYVFGGRELAARVRPNPEADWIDVRLPSNGVKVPDIPNKEISFGKLKVRFEVEPVLTPIGLIRVRVRVLGGQSGERYAVSISNNRRSLVCGPVDGTLHLRNWLRKTPFTVRVESLRATQVKLTARVQREPSGRRVDLDGPAGSIAHARFGKDGEFVEAPTLHDERSILEVRDRYSSTFGRELSTDLWVPQGAAWSQGMACMRAATHGQVLEATHYKLGPAMTANIELVLPDPSLFVKSRYASGHGGIYYSPPSRWFPARKD